MAKKTILALDDEPKITKALKIQFETRGFKVIETTSVPQAKSKLRASLPDLVITDLKIPIYDGFILISDMKHKDKYKGIPIIVLSGVIDEQKKKKLLELGIQEQDIFTKPYSFDELHKRVREVLFS